MMPGVGKVHARGTHCARPRGPGNALRQAAWQVAAPGSSRQGGCNRRFRLSVEASVSVSESESRGRLRPQPDTDLESPRPPAPARRSGQPARPG